MFKLLAAVLALLALVSSPAAAWPAHLAVSGGGGYTGPGDVVGSAVGVYSLRAYLTSQAGDGVTKLVKLHRASDAAECDFLSASGGGIGNATAGCSAGSGISVTSFLTSTTATIVTFYDLSGNGRDATQGTVANQYSYVPGCFPSGAPCARAAGSQFYAITATTLSQPMTMEVVGKRTGSFTSAQAILADNGNNANAQYSSTADTVGVFASSTLSASATDNVFHVLQFEANGASSAVAVDASTTTGSAGASGWTGVWLLGSISNGSPSFSPVGDFGEFIIWNSGFTSSTLNSNAHAYYGF